MSEGRIAVVTGAASGLGRATARALAEGGHRVVLTALGELEAREAAETLAAKDVMVVPRVLDVGSDESVERLFAWLDEAFGRIDVWVNNAGVIPEAGAPATLAVPLEAARIAFEINTLGPWRTLRQALPRMNRQGFGRVVNVSSGMGSLTAGGGGHPAYRVSKAAQNAVTRVFAAEAGPNVKVNAVCPGWVRTALGGGEATRSVEEGIPGIVWAATLPEDGPNGGFFRDGRPIPW